MITFGFYDSKNHDRRYNAIQFGSIFDGIINDGIYMSIGTCFRVTPSEGMTVLVGEGRAWFDHTWTLNDAPLPKNLPESEVLLDRIDAIVLDIYSDRSHRINDVIVIKGTPSNKPQRPTLINEDSRHQYPLAYISVRAGVTSIRAADITSVVGTSSTPYVTGILETVNIDALLDQWQDQWNEFFETQTASSEEEWNTWFNEYKEMMLAFTNASQKEFIEWFETLEYILNGDTGAKLTLELLKLQEAFTKFRNDLLKEHAIYDNLLDDLSSKVLDSNGNEIDGRVMFAIMCNRKENECK